ncbi:MAG: ornithine cyclodeaminase family protein [Beijerinckiaceae bacterium]
MLVIGREAIDRALDFDAAILALERAFRGGMTAPPRHHHTIDPASCATQLLMPAWTSDLPARGSFLGTKIVSVFPQNAGQRLPAVHGTYVLQSGETGVPLAVLDGTRLTHWRTAAVSALAARDLGRPDARRLLVCGAGALAPMLVKAFKAVRPIEEVSVWNHRPAGAENLVETLRRGGQGAKVADHLSSAVAAADIITCATLAREPFLRGDWLSPGTHVDLIGAFRPGMREADDCVLQRARIFIDTERALSEGGEVALAIACKAIGAGHVVGSLADLLGGEVRGRRDAQDITLFKSVGTAIADLAMAMLVWQRMAPSSAPET